MANEEWEALLREIEQQAPRNFDELIDQFGDPGKMKYSACKQLGHDWGKPYSLLPWWYKPWKKRTRFKKCQGCGIAQLVERR